MGTSLDLMQGERVVLSSDQDILVLTNLRVRYRQVVWGQQEVVGITLDSVSSVGLVSGSKPILLVLAGIAVLAGLATGRDTTVMFFVIAAVLVALFFGTRRRAISVASNGGATILAPASGLGEDACMKFINGVERAKLERLNV